MRLAAGCVLVALALAACGKVGPPVAPELRLPRPASDLRGVVSTGAIEISWTNPSRREDNTRVRDLARARVFRYETADDREPKPAVLSRGRIVGYTEVARVPLGVPSAPGVPGGPEAAISGDRVTLRDRQGLVFGNRYTYVVLVEDARGRESPPSPRLTVTYVAPPQTPGGLTATPGEREVRLTWQAPTRLVDLSPVTGTILYEVLRALDPVAPLMPLTPAPITETELVDRNLENDRPYYYAVRALRQAAGSTVRGDATDRVTATPTDLTPPAPPAGLVATPAPGGVRLSWGPSPDPDVGAYVVYRAPQGGAFVRVGSVAAPGTVFVDRDAPAGTYRYAVTAQDRSARANESGRSNEVTVSVP